MKKTLNIAKIIAVIIGTIIGAGFASGKEIFIFFAQYGRNGLIGAIVSSILTAIVIYSTILIVKKVKISNNNEFVEQLTNNSRITRVLKNIINIFLTISFWIMSAGFCSFFKQEFGMPIIIISIVNAIITYILLMKNIDGVIKLNILVVPIMIGIIIIISMKNYPITSVLNGNLNIETKNMGRAILDAVLYTSYNSITLIPIIITLEKNIENKKMAKIIIFLTSFIVFVLIISIYQMLTLCTISVKNIELPILAILKECHPIEKTIYSVAIITAILTSAISSGYGVLENIKDKNKYKKIALIICALEIPISYLGFGNLVSVLYPTFGLIGIIQIIAILKRANSIAKNNKN